MNNDAGLQSIRDKTEHFDQGARGVRVKKSTNYS